MRPLRSKAGPRAGAEDDNGELGTPREATVSRANRGKLRQDGPAFRLNLKGGPCCVDALVPPSPREAATATRRRGGGALSAGTYAGSVPLDPSEASPPVGARGRRLMVAVVDDGGRVLKESIEAAKALAHRGTDALLVVEVAEDGVSVLREPPEWVVPTRRREGRGGPLGQAGGGAYGDDEPSEAGAPGTRHESGNLLDQAASASPGSYDPSEAGVPRRRGVRRLRMASVTDDGVLLDEDDEATASVTPRGPRLMRVVPVMAEDTSRLDEGAEALPSGARRGPRLVKLVEVAADGMVLNEGREAEMPTPRRGQPRRLVMVEVEPDGNVLAEGDEARPAAARRGPRRKLKVVEVLDDGTILDDPSEAAKPRGKRGGPRGIASGAVGGIGPREELEEMQPRPRLRAFDNWEDVLPDLASRRESLEAAAPVGKRGSGGGPLDQAASNLPNGEEPEEGSPPAGRRGRGNPLDQAEADLLGGVTPRENAAPRGGRGGRGEPQSGAEHDLPAEDDPDEAGAPGGRRGRRGPLDQAAGDVPAGDEPGEAGAPGRRGRPTGPQSGAEHALPGSDNPIENPVPQKGPARGRYPTSGAEHDLPGDGDPEENQAPPRGLPEPRQPSSGAVGDLPGGDDPGENATPGKPPPRGGPTSNAEYDLPGDDDPAEEGVPPGRRARGPPATGAAGDLPGSDDPNENSVPGKLPKRGGPASGAEHELPVEDDPAEHAARPGQPGQEEPPAPGAEHDLPGEDAPAENAVPPGRPGREEPPASGAEHDVPGDDDPAENDAPARPPTREQGEPAGEPSGARGLPGRDDPDTSNVPGRPEIRPRPASGAEQDLPGDDDPTENAAPPGDNTSPDLPPPTRSRPNSGAEHDLLGGDDPPESAQPPNARPSGDAPSGARGLPIRDDPPPGSGMPARPPGTRQQMQPSPPLGGEAARLPGDNDTPAEVDAPDAPLEGSAEPPPGILGGFLRQLSSFLLPRTSVADPTPDLEEEAQAPKLDVNISSERLPPPDDEGEVAVAPPNSAGAPVAPNDGAKPDDAPPTTMRELPPAARSYEALPHSTMADGARFGEAPADGDDVAALAGGKSRSSSAARPDDIFAPELAPVDDPNAAPRDRGGSEATAARPASVDACHAPGGTLNDLGSARPEPMGADEAPRKVTGSSDDTRPASTSSEISLPNLEPMDADEAARPSGSDGVGTFPHLPIESERVSPPPTAAAPLRSREPSGVSATVPPPEELARRADSAADLPAPRTEELPVQDVAPISDEAAAAAAPRGRRSSSLLSLLPRLSTDGASLTKLPSFRRSSGSGSAKRLSSDSSRASKDARLSSSSEAAARPSGSDGAAPVPSDTATTLPPVAQESLDFLETLGDDWGRTSSFDPRAKPAKRRGSLGPAGSLVSTGLELGQMPEEPAPADDDSGAQALGRVALNDAARPGGPKAGDGGGSNDSERALETPQDLDMPPRLIPSSTHSNLGTPVGTPRQDLSAPPACLPSMSSEDIFDGSGRDSLRLEPNDEDSLRDMYGDPDEQLVVHEEAPKRRRISLDEMTPRPSVQLEMSEAGGPGWPGLAMETDSFGPAAGRAPLHADAIADGGTWLEAIETEQHASQPSTSLLDLGRPRQLHALHADAVVPVAPDDTQRRLAMAREEPMMTFMKPPVMLDDIDVDDANPEDNDESDDCDDDDDDEDRLSGLPSEKLDGRGSVPEPLTPLAPSLGFGRTSSLRFSLPSSDRKTDKSDGSGGGGSGGAPGRMSSFRRSGSMRGSRGSGERAGDGMSSPRTPRGYRNVDLGEFDEDEQAARPHLQPTPRLAPTLACTFKPPSTSILTLAPPRSPGAGGARAAPQHDPRGRPRRGAPAASRPVVRRRLSRGGVGRAAGQACG